MSEIILAKKRYYHYFCCAKRGVTAVVRPSPCPEATTFVRGVAQMASVLAWGARGRGFESRHPDPEGGITMMPLFLYKWRQFKAIRKMSRFLVDKRLLFLQRTMSSLRSIFVYLNIML